MSGLDGFRQVAPGLYQRINSPRHVRISDKFAAIIKAEGSSLLNKILLQAIEEQKDDGGL